MDFHFYCEFTLYFQGKTEIPRTTGRYCFCTVSTLILSSVKWNNNINNESSVELEAHLFGLKPGESAIHIHEFADCSSMDGLSSGGHWNPTSQPHGKWGDEEGFHLGDIGNFSVDSIGHGMVKFNTDLWCINCSDRDKDLIGRSIVIHNGSDDYISQPSGAAGIRIGCMGISSDIIDNVESN